MLNKKRLEFFPISYFSIILGLSGFTIALQKIEHFMKFKIILSNYFLFLTVFIYLLITVIYLLKSVRFPQEVKKEWNNPIKLNFFPTFSISLLLLSIALLEVNLLLSKILWFSGTFLHFIFTLTILNIWIYHKKFEIHQINPAWFIPIVGTMLIPVAGSQHFYMEVSWFFFSSGIFFWLMLFTIIFYRMIFHHPIIEKLIPTLFILIAPPAIGFISYSKLNGSLDNFGILLYYFALFITILLFTQIKTFSKIRFFLSWWAYSFPISSITIASVLMFHKTHKLFFKYLAFSLFLILTSVIIVLVYRTISAIFKKEICLEE